MEECYLPQSVLEGIKTDDFRKYTGTPILQSFIMSFLDQIEHPLLFNLCSHRYWILKFYLLQNQIKKYKNKLHLKLVMFQM